MEAPPLCDLNVPRSASLAAVLCSPCLPEAPHCPCEGPTCLEKVVSSCALRCAYCGWGAGIAELGDGPYQAQGHLPMSNG